ncbi:MAG: zf-HC2 domain-containing protein [Acidimicrobiia bacterium]
MSAPDCAEIVANAPELALGVLPGDLRAEALAHLEHCATCRVVVDELSQIADTLLLAAAPAEPPPGFGTRVTALFPSDQPRRRASRPRVLVAAALLIIAVAGPRLVASGITGTGHRANADRDLRTVRLVSRDQRDIGDASAYRDSPAWYFMRVTRGQPDGTYRCVLVLDNGWTRTLGRLVVSDGTGAWGGHLHLDVRHVRAAQLVDAADHALATATFN